MRTLKRIVLWALVLAAFAIVLSTGFSDHESDYGEVPLPQGGTVELPEGSVKVFYQEEGEAQQPIRLDTPISFEVTPADGGAPLEIEATSKDGSGELQVERSQDLNALGSIAKIDVPSEGDYLVSGSSGLAPGVSSLNFGTDPFTAIARRWRLLAGLLGGALLVALIPLPRRRAGHWDEPASGAWSA